MIREYTIKDYEFVLNSLVGVQKDIKMDVAPICGKSVRNKRASCAKFLKTLIVPDKICYIVEDDKKKFGFVCFKPIQSDACFLEFFLKAPDVNMSPSYVKLFRDHIRDVKTRHGYKKMFATIANRKDYNRWLKLSKKFLNPRSVTLQQKNYYLLEF